MRASFVWGIIGGIITFLVGTFNQAFNDTSMGLVYLTIVSFIAGILGIVGGAIGMKKGGILMIIGGILALIGGGLFGILGLMLLIGGGILAFKEKPTTTTTAPSTPT